MPAIAREYTEQLTADLADFEHMHDTQKDSPCGSYINLDEHLAAAQCSIQEGRNSFDGVVGSSQAFREVLDQIRTVAPTDSTVLIEGETGTVLTKGDVLLIPALPTFLVNRTNPVTLVEAERDHLLKALEESNWVVGGKAGAAARLGVKRTTLIDKIRKRGLVREMVQPRV